MRISIDRRIAERMILRMRHTCMSVERGIRRMGRRYCLGELFLYLLFNFTNMSEVISTRIPKELKEEMKRVNVNWEDFLRRAIEEKVKEEKRKMAVKMMDESRKKTEGIKFDSVEVIRGLREKR